MRCSEHQVVTSDATSLFVRTITPDDATRTARTLVIVHGTSEHGGRYEHVAREAVSQGWDVIIPDLRGHGRSEGVPVHVERFNRYLLDFDSLWQFFELNPDRTAIMAHSFGGLLSARFAQTRPTRLAALILLSPLIGLQVRIDPLTWVLGRCMSVIAPKTRFKSRVPSGHTSRNPQALARRESDPLIHRSVTARWFFEMRKALAAVQRDASRLHVPVLALQAGADYIVDPLAVEPWLMTTGSHDRTFRMYPDHYHELMNELDWSDTLDAALHWLDLRLPARSSPSRADS